MTLDSLAARNMLNVPGSYLAGFFVLGADVSAEPPFGASNFASALIGQEFQANAWHPSVHQ